MNNTAKWLLDAPGNKKWHIVGLTICQALHGGSGVLFALLMRQIVDAAGTHAKDIFWKNLWLLGMVIIGQMALRAIIRWQSELAKSTFENIFKKRLFETLLQADFQQVAAMHSGEWLNRLTNDAVVVANGYVEILPGLSGMVVKLISATIMIIALEPRFALLLFPGGALMVVATWLFRRVLKRMHKRIQEADGRLRIFLQERLGSLLMIRSFAAEEQTLREAEEKMLAHKDARMRKNHFSNFSNIAFGTAMNGMYLLGVGWCGYGILVGTISYGTLTAITQLISQIQSPFANISGYLPRYYAMLASAERLMEAEGLDKDGKASSLDDMIDFYHDKLVCIGLKNASFAYGGSSSHKQDMPMALHDISLSIRKGEYVAFTGHSGCGKSTALKLLMCVYRLDEGTRYYVDRQDNTKELTFAHRRLFAYVPQGNALMNGTIREVVCFADMANASDDDRLQLALRVACADEFVKGLEKGVDTPLKERGASLSEGQMQRIAIARAIFANSPILLLDESTSALDTDTEKKLLHNLREMTDKTVIIVTHRPAALSICDRVLRFTENGVIET